MTMTKENTSTTEMVDELEKVNQRYIKEYMPAIIVVTIVIILGLVGNIFTVIYYGWKAQKAVVQLLVLALSFNDLVTNIALIQDIVDFCFTVTYRSAATCKLFFFLKHWFVGNSLLFMVGIAIDRYRRVSYPFSKQFTQQAAKYLILGFSIVSLLLSLRYFVTADIVRNNLTMETNGTKGYYCTLSETESVQSIEDVFHKIDIFLHAIIICSLIAFYFLVVRKVLNIQRKLKSYSKFDSVNSRKGFTSPNWESSNTEVVETQLSNTHDDSSDLHEKRKTVGNNRPSVSISTVSNCFIAVDKTMSFRFATISRNFKSKRRRNANLRAEVRVTIMVAVITLASVLCFVPYYLAMLLINSNMSGDGLILSVGNVLLRRTYMLNSVINPFIMAFYNEPFRRFIRQTITCKCKKGK